MSRAILRIPFLNSEGNSFNPEKHNKKISFSPFFALTVQTYIFSYMAINSFVTYRLHEFWEMENSPLKLKYPKANSFQHLLNTDLRELKECIKELCNQLCIPQIFESNPALWDDLLSNLKLARHFFTHPIPDQEKLDEIINISMINSTWSFASDVAEKIMKYFYEKCNQPAPDYLTENKEFVFSGVKFL